MLIAVAFACWAVDCRALWHSPADGPESDRLQGRAADRRHRPSLYADHPRDPRPASVRDRRADDGPPARLRAERAGRRPRRRARVRQGHVGARGARALAEGPDRPARHWIEVGQPEERRLVKASGRADRVSVYAFSHGAPVWWAGLGHRVARAGNVEAWQIPAEQSRELAALAQRGMQLQVNRQDGVVCVGRRRALGRDHAAAPVARAAMSDADSGRGRSRCSISGSARPATPSTAGPARLVREGRRLRRRDRASASARRSSRPCAASSRPGPTRRARRWRRSSCSTSSRATPFAARRAPSPATRARWRRRAAMVGARQDEALPGFMRAFVYLPFEHAEGLAMQDEAVRLFTRLVVEDARRSRRARLRAPAPRRDRALRPLPAPQRDPRPPVDGRGDRVPEAARLGF